MESFFYHAQVRHFSESNEDRITPHFKGTLLSCKKSVLFPLEGNHICVRTFLEKHTICCDPFLCEKTFFLSFFVLGVHVIRRVVNRTEKSFPLLNITSCSLLKGSATQEIIL